MSYDIEPGDPTWQTIKRWAKDEIERNRDIAGRAMVGEREADAARGAIGQLEQLLALEKVSPLTDSPYAGDGISED